MITMNTPKKRGVKPGVKNALKHESARRREIQQVSYTKAEFAQVKDDMAAAGVSAHTHYARRAVVNYRESQRVIAAAKKLIELYYATNEDFSSLNQVASYHDAAEIIRTYQENS